MPPKLKAFLTLVLMSLVLDQGSKAWIVSHLDQGGRIPVIDGFFYISHVRNPGAAFSLFATSPELFRRYFFIGVALVAIALIVSFYRRLTPGDRLSAAALGLVLGGAVGNLLDRLRYGEVVDFLRVKLWSGYTWPDFNFADSCIVVGVGLLVLELFASEGEARADPRGSDAQTREASPPSDESVA